MSGESIIDAARISGADAIHPDCGFLGETPTSRVQYPVPD
ncbi:hypothetical protein [Mycobacterium sp.]